MGGKLIKISFVNDEAETFIFGPRNKLFDPPPDEIQIPLTLTLHPAERSVTLAASGQRETLGERKWSQWFSLAFPFNALVKARGIARFHLVSYEPFRLYLSAVNLDPRDPPFPVSHPKEYARAVASRFGLFKTLGWDIDTWALNEERIDEAIFLEDVDSTTVAQERYGAGLLGEKDDRLFVNVFQFTDRVAHMFWRTLESDHPAYDSIVAEKYRNVIRDSYVQMDGIVGEAVKSLGPEDVLLVCSDHGFASWKWSVNYNTWLAREGFLTLEGKGGEKQKRLEDLFGQGQFWPNVNWKKTKAYSLGLGNIYINLKGREAEGTVEPGAEYERIRNEIIAKLLAFTDPANGRHPVRRVFKREEIYRGYDENLIPDLFVANDNGYRVSWQTSLGGFPPELIEPNPKKWSGDHCSLDPEIVKGVFFASVPMTPGPAPTITDLCPTILALLDVPVPGDLDGKVIPVASGR
jgi:predicted AlkP superfamily phosphohydrolase/phosphomutase